MANVAISATERNGGGNASRLRLQVIAVGGLAHAQLPLGLVIGGLNARACLLEVRELLHPAKATSP